jgi:hypothetical protein
VNDERTTPLCSERHFTEITAAEFRRSANDDAPLRIQVQVGEPQGYFVPSWPKPVYWPTSAAS